MQTTFVSNLAAKQGIFGISQWFSVHFLAQPQRPVTDDTRLANIRALQLMARELDSNQPNLAAELRNFAARS